MFKRSLFASILALSAPALADPPVIQNVVVSRHGELWRFDVTLRHKDTGWDHYADAWRIVDPDGRILGTRNLAHPHIKEQPFTRSLSGVRIPEDVTEVGIQARDNLEGWAEHIEMVPLR